MMRQLGLFVSSPIGYVHIIFVNVHVVTVITLYILVFIQYACCMLVSIKYV
jgi:hypothetical protein